MESGRSSRDFEGSIYTAPNERFEAVYIRYY